MLLLKVQHCSYKWTRQPKCTKLLVFALLCKLLAYDAKKLINKHCIHRYHMKIMLLWCPNWFFHSKLSTKNTNYTNSFQCNSANSKKRKGNDPINTLVFFSVLANNWMQLQLGGGVHLASNAACWMTGWLDKYMVKSSKISKFEF